MIRLINEGTYTLSESKTNTRILYLNNNLKKTFAWISADEIGEILVTTHKKHMPKSIISTGSFRLYEVQDEEKLTDLQHLELFVGNGMWQGYLLPTGLPDNKDKRNRIIATKEIISVSSV